jgi:integrase
MGVSVRQKVKGGPYYIFVSRNGKRKSRKIGDKRTAEQVAAKIRAKLELGGYSFERPKQEPKIPTFTEYSNYFMAGYSQNNHKASSQRAYRKVIDRHFKPRFGNMRLDEIEKADVKNCLYALRGKGLAYSTVQNLRAYLSAIFGQAVDDGVLTINPVSKTGKYIKKPEKPRRRITAFTWEERTILERAVEKHFPEWYALVVLDFRTGIRLGEICALEIGDVDFDGRFIEVRQNYDHEGDKITTPKSGKARRVDMSPHLVKVLQAHIKARKESQWLFHREDGSIVNPRHLSDWLFKRWLKVAGLAQSPKRLSFNSIRHSYATLRLQKGDNILDVSRQLGHHSVRVTEASYYDYVPGTHKN